MVYFLTAERGGSLWDCGEFILGAYKLQVVHPPGAPMFLIVGRLFAWLGDMFSTDPSTIAFAVNLMSGMCTAAAAMFVCWTTIILSKMIMVGREESLPSEHILPVCGSGLVAGLATAFCSSIWFSAVEGEVYAMSTFFTAMTVWSTLKWYSLPDESKYDRWLVFTIYSAGLSIGVHLLSLLTFPALAMFYYFKKYKKHSFWGMVVAGIIGAMAIILIQAIVITGIPNLWASLELFAVNQLGLPFDSGLLPTALLVGSTIAVPLLFVHNKIKSPIPIYTVFGLFILATLLGTADGSGSILGILIKVVVLAGAAYAIVKYRDRFRHGIQLLFVTLGLLIVSFSTFGVVVIRASADTPINMNDPDDAMRLLPYLNRETIWRTATAQRTAL